MKNLSCIKNYDNRTEAEFAKGLLNINGIESIVSADDCGGMEPPLQLGRVRLLVKKEDAQHALKVLEESNDK